MTVVTLYTKDGCHLCAEARDALLRVQGGRWFELVELDITLDEELHRAYFERIPVVALDGEELFDYFVDEDALRDRLGAPPLESPRWRSTS
jgi:glutaredoxin